MPNLTTRTTGCRKSNKSNDNYQEERKRRIMISIEK